MRLTVIGCSGSFPGPESPASCYLVEAEGFRLLLDLGNGALGALQRRVPLQEIDAVILSHLHADHCLDLCSYYVFRTYHPDGPLPPIPVYGPAGTDDRMRRAYEAQRAKSDGMGAMFDFHTIAPGRCDIGPFRLEFGRVNHPVETYAMRVERAGGVLVYSADTGESDSLVRLARDADLLVCEASFVEGRDAEPDLHLTGRQAAEHAVRAGVGRLLLTHLVSWNDPRRTLDEAAAVWRGPLELARSQAGYDIR